MSWNYLRITNFHSRVRALLDNISEASISNMLIDMPEKAPMAERDIKAIVTNWETFQLEDKDKFEIFQSCIVYKTAIMFEGYARSAKVKRRQVADVNVEYHATDYNLFSQASMSLSDMLDSLLSQLIEGSTTFFGIRVT